MPISYADYLEMLRRTSGARHRDIEQSDTGCSKEIEELHLPIIEFCNKQRPRWKYIHARPDRKSTIGLGCPDFHVFAPGRRLFIFECKTRDGKADTDQLAWHHEMALLGWEVKVIRSYPEFLAAVLG